MARQRAMTWRVFERRYEPIVAPDGGQTFEYIDLPTKDPYHTWAVVDGDNGEAYILPGFHVVNVFAWMATRKPWTDAEAHDLVVKW
mgnify:CR=1 FL=1